MFPITEPKGAQAVTRKIKPTNPADIFEQHLNATSPYRCFIKRGYTHNVADRMATRYIRRFGTPPTCHCKTCLDYRARMVAALYGSEAAK